jgi:hypothetical protein
MARHLFSAITLIGIGVLLNSPTKALDAFQCADRSANCVGRCANPSGGAWYHNRCMSHCDRQSMICLIRAHDAERRWWRPGANVPVVR